MRAIIRREILNYLKRPLFWLAVAVVVFGVFQELHPYLTIHYITSEEELQNGQPETVRKGDIYDGYIPVGDEEHRKLWEKAVQETLRSDFGMDAKEAAAVIQQMRGMAVPEACSFLEEQYGCYNMQYTWEDTSYRKGTMDEVNAYIAENLKEHPFSYYFSRKFADYSGLYMGFAATVLLAFLFLQDMRKNTYELLHTKPIRAAQYVIGKAMGGFIVCLLILGILDLVFWAACLVCTQSSGFEVRLTDFLFSTCLYILPNMLMIVCVYTIVALLFQNPLPAVPLLILYMVYSNMGTNNAAGVYAYRGRPLAIMVRFPDMFFDVTPPPFALLNQFWLLVVSGLILWAGVRLWRRRRI